MDGQTEGARSRKPRGRAWQWSNTGQTLATYWSNPGHILVAQLGVAVVKAVIETIVKERSNTVEISAHASACLRGRDVAEAAQLDVADVLRMEGFNMGQTWKYWSNHT